jgi:hypothetical protein
MNKRSLCVLSLCVAMAVAMLAVPAIAIPGQPNTYVVSVELVGHGTVAVGTVPLYPGHTTFTSNEVITYSDIPGAGVNVTATATPDAGWSFDHWELGPLASPSTTTLTPETLALSPAGTSPSNWVLRAVFKHSIAVSANPTAGGTVSGGGAYADGASVTVVASPGSCYTFLNWMEGSSQVSGDASYTFNATENRTLVASFTPKTYTIAASAGTGGSISPSGDVVVNCGTNQTFTIAAATGYQIGAVSVDGNPVGAVTSYPFTNVTAAHTISATFTPIDYTLTVNITGNGTVAKSPNLATYHYGDVVTLTPTADPGWTFDSFDKSVPVTITGNTVVAATFTQNHYTLGITIVGSGTVAKSPNKEDYHYNDVVTLTPTAAAGWTFSVFSPTSPVTITANTTVTATFIQSHYTLDVTIVGSGTVAKNPNELTYHYGDVIVLTATPSAGWTFSGFSPASPVTITANTTVTATFTDSHYTLGITIVGSGTVAKSPDQATYHYGAVVTLTATPAAGWTFSGFSPASPVTITGNTTVTATFVLDALLFFDNMEGGKKGWTVSTTNWALVTTVCQPNMPSPVTAWGFGKNGLFTGTGILTSAKINVTGQTQVAVEFWYCLQLNTPRAYLNATVQIQLGTGTWKTIWTSTGKPRGAWTKVGPLAVNIPVRVTTLRLRFNVTGSKYAGCFTIDDVKVSRSGGLRAATAELDLAPTASAFRIESVGNSPNPIRDVNTTTFSVKGVGIEEICVNIYDQTGLMVFTSGWQPNDYDWHVESSDGETLANGVYLYTVVVRGVTGEIVLTEVRKLAVYR